MKISLDDTHHIERYLNNELSNEERILFEAKLILNPHFKLHVGLLKQIQSVVKLFARRRMKAEIEKIHHKLFHNPEHLIFQQRIQQLFKDK